MPAGATRGGPVARHPRVGDLVYAVEVSSGKMHEQRADAVGDQGDVAAPEPARPEEQVAGLTAALAANRVISTAVGLVMERLGLDRAAAHAHLVGLAQAADQTLVGQAEELVREADSGVAR